MSEVARERCEGGVWSLFYSAEAPRAEDIAAKKDHQKCHSKMAVARRLREPLGKAPGDLAHLDSLDLDSQPDAQEEEAVYHGVFRSLGQFCGYVYCEALGRDVHYEAAELEAALYRTFRKLRHMRRPFPLPVSFRIRAADGLAIDVQQL